MAILDDLTAKKKRKMMKLHATIAYENRRGAKCSTSSGARDSILHGMRSFLIWNRVSRSAKPHRTYRRLRTVRSRRYLCDNLVNHSELVFFPHRCAETPICAKTPMITVVGSQYNTQYEGTKHVPVTTLQTPRNRRKLPQDIYIASL